MDPIPKSRRETNPGKGIPKSQGFSSSNITPDWHFGDNRTRWDIWLKPIYPITSQNRSPAPVFTTGPLKISFLWRGEQTKSTGAAAFGEEAKEEKMSCRQISWMELDGLRWKWISNSRLPPSSKFGIHRIGDRGTLGWKKKGIGKERRCCRRKKQEKKWVGTNRTLGNVPVRVGNAWSSLQQSPSSLMEVCRSLSSLAPNCIPANRLARFFSFLWSRDFVDWI